MSITLSPDVIPVGQRLCDARLADGRSLKTLQRETGIPQEDIRRFEKGHYYRLSVGNLLILCLTLEIDPSTLFRLPEADEL